MRSTTQRYAAEPGAVLGLAAGDLGFDAALAELAPVLVVVVAAVGGDPVGPPARPADLAAHRRHAVEQRDQLGDVVAVAAGDRPGERDPGRVDEKVMLRAVFWLYQPGSGPFRSPLFRLHVTGVRDRPRPLDLTRRPQLGQQERVQPLPDTGLLPLIHPPVTGRADAEPELERQMPPRDPGVQHKQDPLQRLPIGSRLRPG